MGGTPFMTQRSGAPGVVELLASPDVGAPASWPAPDLAPVAIRAGYVALLGVMAAGVERPGRSSLS